MKRKLTTQNQEQEETKVQVETVIEETKPTSKCSFKGYLIAAVSILAIMAGFLYRHNLNPSAQHHVSQPNTNYSFERIYKQVETLGSGAFGVTVLVVRRDDTSDNPTKYAAKLFRHGFHEGGAHEADIMRRIDHPRMPSLVETFEGGWFQSSVMVMELVPGKQLGTHLKNLPKPIDQDQMSGYLHQVIDLVQYLHNNQIIHCDVHFGNMMIDSNEQIYLLDFSTSKVLENGVFDPSKDKEWGYTPWCYAPEVYLGKSYSFNADFFEVACWFTENEHEKGYDIFKSLSGVEDVWEGGMGEGWKLYKSIVEKEPVLPTFNKFSPETGKLISQMLDYNPENRPDFSKQQL